MVQLTSKLLCYAFTNSPTPTEDEHSLTSLEFFAYGLHAFDEYLLETVVVGDLDRILDVRTVSARANIP